MKLNDEYLTADEAQLLCDALEDLGVKLEDEEREGLEAFDSSTRGVYDRLSEKINMNKGEQ